MTSPIHSDPRGLELAELDEELGERTQLDEELAEQAGGDRQWQRQQCDDDAIRTQK